MKISICLEGGREGVGAFAPDCPGCWVFGRTSESALKKVKATAVEWFEWLRRHGEIVDVKASDVEIVVEERRGRDLNP